MITPPPRKRKKNTVLQHRFEFGGTGALKSQRHGVKAQRTVESFEPLMKRPFEFLFPEINATHKHFPLPRFVPDRTLLHGNLLAIACDAFHVPKSLRNRDTIQNRFPYFRGHVTDLYPLSRSDTGKMRVYFGMHTQDPLEFTEQYIIVKRSGALVTYHTASARFCRS